MGLWSVVIATLLDSLTGLVGVFSLFIREEMLSKVVKTMVAFAAGTMLGGALLHMLPRAASSFPWAGEVAALGFISFFLLERILHWHHCHEGVCEVHPITSLTIVGDSLHNLIDGVIIAAAFHADPALGWLTTFLIIAHEVPQELGNFLILVYGGMKKERAVLWTFFSQATCILGGILGWFFIPKEMVLPVIAFAAGGFLYISASDLVPELHKEKDLKKSLVSFLWFLTGLAFMEVMKLVR